MTHLPRLVVYAASSSLLISLGACGDEGLNSPIGMALVRDRLFVADTDAVLGFPYRAGDLAIKSPGKTLAQLPAGERTTTGPKISSPAAMAQPCMPRSARTATWPKTA